MNPPDTKNNNFTLVSTPILNKDNKWEFTIEEPSKDKLVLTFNTEKEAADKHLEYTLQHFLDKDKKKVELSDAQKLIILKIWDSRSTNPPSVMELLEAVFPDIEDKFKDTRSRYGRAIKEYLISKDLKQLPAPPSAAPILTDEMKEYILNNCATMGVMEMAREIWGNPRIGPNTIEVRLVKEFIKNEVPKEVLYDKGENLDDGQYTAPKQVSHVLKRIKNYVSVAETWELDKLSPIQKKCCIALSHYLHDLRFARQINSYEKQEDKKTFEAEFVKFTYDKPELTQEEISQFISLCSFVVMEFNIKSHIERLQSQIEAEYDENNKVSGNLIDALESARTDLNNCVIRQKDLYNNLTQKRSDKISKELKDKESLLNLINAWRQYDSRQRMLTLAKEKKDILRKEIHELENLDEIKMRILGMSVDEILNG